MKNVRRRLLILLFFGVIVLFSCLMFLFRPDKSNNTALSPQLLVLRLPSSPITFNPIMCKDISSATITSLVFSGLVKYADDGVTIKPALAQRWEVLDNGKRWRFFLRDNIFWSDGHPITAFDVKFTFDNIIFNPDIPTPIRGMFIIDGRKVAVKVVSEKVVDFILPSSYSPFLSLMTVAILPKHKLVHRLNDGTISDAYNLSEAEHIVGSGAFVIKKYVTNEMIILERNKYYYLNKPPDFLPKLERIVFVIVRSSDTALLKFLDGQIDILSLRPEDVFFLKKQRKSIRFVESGIANASLFLVFNQRQNANIPKYKISWFRDIRFRKAISLAIDRENIINLIYYGLGEIVCGPMERKREKSLIINECRKNIDKAKSLLLDMGFEGIDSDGILEDKKGRKLKFTIVVSSNSTTGVNMAELISADLLKLGVDAKVAVVDFNKLVWMLTSQFNWEAAIVGVSVEGDPYFYSQVFKSDGELHFWRQHSDANRFQEEIDAIFNDMAKCFDLNRKMLLIKKLQKLIIQSYDTIYLPVPQIWYAVNDRVDKLAVSSSGRIDLERIEVERRQE